MHELSLCRSIYGIADGARRGREVRTIHLRIGQLRQVVPETLSYCWGLVTDETPLSGSVLEIEHLPVTLSCMSCEAETVVGADLMIACGSCGSREVRIVGGEEFLVTTMDLKAQTDAEQEALHG